MKSKAENFWDGRAESFDGPGLEINRPDELVDIARDYLGPDKKVLVFACGTGTRAIRLAGLCHSVLGIDISEKMIGIAAAKALSARVDNAAFRKATIFDEEISGESFDIITAFYVLHLLEDPAAAIRRMYALLRPGGFLLSATPGLGRGSLLWAAFSSLLGQTGIVPHLKMRKDAEIEGYFQDAGFRVLATNKLGKSPPILYLAGKK